MHHLPNTDLAQRWSSLHKITTINRTYMNHTTSTINQVPVLLLTGYLGSGKTTLLNRILTNKQGIRFAVIVNDLGEVNIDAELIQKGGVVNQQEDSLVALQNGCICCTLQTDLIEQLHELVASNMFDYIVIEASGICEPAPIAQTICSMPTMAPQLIKDGVPALDAVVTVVDALRIRDEFSNGHELVHNPNPEEDLASLVIEQIEFCNTILLNKIDEVSEQEAEQIKHIIRAIQPKARIIECNYCDIDLDLILHTHSFHFDEVATSATWIQQLEESEEEHEHEHEHEHHHHEHEHEHHHGHHHGHCHEHCHEHHGEADEYGITTFVYYRRKPMDINRFDEFVARQWPKQVIRAKGMCWFSTQNDMCFLFEQAGKQFQIKEAGAWFATMPQEELMQQLAYDKQLQRDWDDTCGDRMQKIVFIGQHMDKKQIEELLDNCLVSNE